MLTVSDLSCRISGRPIISGANFQLADSWRLGVVGANGAGKTTLFRMLSGEMEPDSGEIRMGEGQRLGILRQELPESDASLLDTVLAADTERAALLHRAETETDAEALAHIHARLNDISAYAAPSRAASILSGLGFSQEEMARPLSSFSGGWRMRVALAAILFSAPDLLLLDEPTNHLDLEAIIWLEEFLTSYPAGLMLISHDRRLLNRVCDHILHVEGGKATLYGGNYDAFESERANKRLQQQRLYEAQQARRAHMQTYIDRFRYKASKARQAQSRIKALERMDLVEAVMAERTPRLNFPQPEELPPPILMLEGADAGYEPGRPVLRRISARIDMDDRIALLGANGNGKSTLIKLIAGKLAPLAGEVRRSSKLRVGYFAQHQLEELDGGETPIRAMGRLMPDANETAVRSRLGQFGFSADHVETKISHLSGGEKARLLFAILTHDAPHLLLLDEPTNHLDMDMREALVEALADYGGAVILVSHDPILVERIADRLWLVKEGALLPFDGDLDDYRALILSERGRRSEAREQGNSKKDRRREAAGKREALAPLRRKVEAAEKEIARISAEKRKLEGEMADPALYADKSRAAEAAKRHARLNEALTAAESAWLEASEAYEAAGM
jgi:ATP-binding cassette subfamily F protein 3